MLLFPISVLPISMSGQADAEWKERIYDLERMMPDNIVITPDSGKSVVKITVKNSKTFSIGEDESNPMLKTLSISFERQTEDTDDGFDWYNVNESGFLTVTEVGEGMLEMVVAYTREPQKPGAKKETFMKKISIKGRLTSNIEKDINGDVSVKLYVEGITDIESMHK